MRPGGTRPLGPRPGCWLAADRSVEDQDLAGGGGLLGQVPGRTSRCVVDWLEARSEACRAGVRFVALDPSAPYAAAVRHALPSATIVVDHFHLVQLANQMVTKVRQRVTQETLGRRGRGGDPVWANRRLLLRGRERLSESAFARILLVRRRRRCRSHHLGRDNR